MASEDYLKIRFNLQLFADDKTEKPTPKRKGEARKKGQVIKSMEINSALILLFTFLAVKLWSPYIYQETARFFRYVFEIPVTKELTLSSLNQIIFQTVLSITKMLAPIAAVAMVGGVVASYGQVGFLFTTETLTPKFDRLNPLAGIKRMFSLRSFVEVIKSLLKILIVGYVAYSAVKGEFSKFPALMQMNIYQSTAYIGQLIVNIAFRVGAVLMVLAIFDYFYQRYEYFKSLKMTKHEIKEEFKQEEGDPKVKAKIKERQRQMSMRRMMQAIPEADVVITNPTHLAIALKYDNENMGAPLVIAKGQDHIAEKIKEIAREHGIVTYENRPLAQALFKSAEVGDEVPAELYQAVAEVLAFVYKLKGKI